jgi:hypothetical protein
MRPTVHLAVLTEPDMHRADGTRLLGVLSYRDDGDSHHRRLARLQPTPTDGESGPVQLQLPFGVALGRPLRARLRSRWERGLAVDTGPVGPRLARVGQAGPVLPLLMIGWLARGEFDRAMSDLHDSCPLDDWPRLHAELQTTLDSIWSLSTARMDRPHDDKQQRHQVNQQRLQLLATAQQHFDPAAAWAEFRETLWQGRDTVTGTTGRWG